jgi:hypothetical protein
MKKGIAILALVILALMMGSGCGHNPSVVTVGKRTNIGLDPGHLAFNVSWSDGFNIIDVPRENTSYEIEIDEGTGLVIDPAANTIRGVRKITRKVGPQMTGYLVKLAKASPAAAAEYVRQASVINSVEAVKLSPHLVTIPLPQSNGTGISKLALWKVKESAAKDTEETVPEGMDMSLEDWKLLKAAYLECPNCLALTDAERKALQKATGK